MNVPRPCECGNGYTVRLSDGRPSCSHTLARFAVLHGYTPEHTIDYLREPETWPVWWKVPNPPNARVLAVLPYTGKYPNHFNAVLRLEAPNNQSGHLEMAVQLEETP